MLLTLLPFAVCAVGLVLLLGPFVSYLLNHNGLRSFPSPSFAAFSSLWRIWHSIHYNHYRAVDQAHKELGTHVRISPNHLSVSDPRASANIYGHGANMMKEGFYDAAAGPHRNLADARDKHEHQAKRKMLAHAFAHKTIVGLEPLLRQSLQTLIDAVESHVESGEMMNMRDYFNYFTIDLLGLILYSTHFDCVARGSDIVDAVNKEGLVYKTPFIKSLHNVQRLNIPLGFESDFLGLTKILFQTHSFVEDGANFDNIILHHTKERFAKGTSQDDLFTRLLQDSKGNNLNLPMGEIVAECSVMMNAGTETTTAAMTNTIYFLYTHPEKLAKLRAELDPIFENGLPTYEAATNSAYLRACTEESLRLRPPVSMGLPRIVPTGGRVIADKFVQGGVTVSVPLYTLLRDEAVFERATEFIPERWLDADVEAKREMMKSHLPFSTGPRACIGRNISYFEQTLVIAALLYYFDLEVPEGFCLAIEERFNANPGDLLVKCKRRVFKA